MATATLDPRLAPDRLLRVGGQVVASLTGSLAGAGNTIARSVAAAAETFAKAVGDTRASSAGPLEQAGRIEAHSAVFLPKVQAAAVEFNSECESVQRAMDALSLTVSYEKGASYNALFDAEIGRAFRAWTEPQRIAAMAMMMNDPLHADLRLADALLRLPSVLTGIDFRTQTLIRVGIARVIMHSDFDILVARSEQLSSAAAAITAAIGVQTNAAASRLQAQELAPAALVLKPVPKWPTA